MLQEPGAWAQESARVAAAQEVLERLVIACARERLIPIGSSECSVTLGERFRVPIARRHSMERLDLAGLPEGFSPQDCDRLFAHFLDELFPQLSPEKRDSLLAELQCSYLNLALSLEALAEAGMGTPGVGDLASWEGRVWCGHPLHPGARLRSGVSPEENRKYGPEWQVRLQLPLLSVPKRSVAELGEFAERLLELYPSLRGAVSSERVLVPVHPWQAEHDLPTRFQARFESGELLFSERTIPARPTMSFRTVILETESGEDYHLKLPVAVQTTGATRTVSVASTNNGPRMSAFLERFMAHPEVRSEGLFQSLHLMAEPASFSLKAESEDRSRFCAAILRKGPGASSESRWLLPVAALLEPRANPLFLRAAEHFGESPETLFAEYCHKLLPPLAYLCGILGVALEAHPQNMLVDFRGDSELGLEIHFWYRDLGGIRLHTGRLDKALRDRSWEELQAPRFWPGSATETDSVRDLSSKFVYSVLQNHLGELIRAVSRQGVEEAVLWGKVAEVLDAHRHLMGADLEQRVFAPTWDLKAMWTMRIDSAITEYTFQPVENPLLRFGRVVKA